MRRPRAARSARRLPEPIKMARLSSPLSSPASLQQVFLVLLYFNESTYQVFYFFATGMIMVPYFLSAMYFCKDGAEAGERSDQRNWYFQRCLRGLDGLCRRHQRHAGNRPLYVPGIFVLCQGTKEKGLKVFETKVDKAVFVALLALLVICIYFVATGRINPLG